MIVRNANTTDCSVIAKLHAESIKTGFLSTLGSSFLIELYKALCLEKETFVLVAEENGTCQGFVAGTQNTHGLFKKVLLKNWFRFMFPLGNVLCSPRKVLKIVETVFYGLKPDEKVNNCEIKAELLSISVDEGARGKGVGKKLVESLENTFTQRGVVSYKVVTFSKDKNANGFYLTCGCKLNRTFLHHGNCMNEYVKKIDD